MKISDKQKKALALAGDLAASARAVEDYLTRDLSHERIQFAGLYNVESLLSDLKEAFRRLEEED